MVLKKKESALLNQQQKCKKDMKILAKQKNIYTYIHIFLNKNLLSKECKKKSYTGVISQKHK